MNMQRSPYDFLESPGEFDYEEAVDLLRNINKDNEERRKALEEKVAELEGATLDTREKITTLFAHANEIGQFVYKSKKDPNALVARFPIQAPYSKKEGFGTGGGHYYAPSYYTPSPQAVMHNRELMAASQRPRKNLVTTEDYFAYFKEFDRKVLGLLIENIQAIELTDGCNAACVEICAVPAKRVKNPVQMPFEVLEWLVKNFPGELQRSEACLYGSSDLQFYKSTNSQGEPVDGVDAIKLLNSIDVSPYVSISFGGKSMIDFLDRLVLQEGLGVGRISRLKGGKEKRHLNWILDQLKERYGAELPEKIVHNIREAFISGGKSGIKTTPLGNAISPETPEKDISTAQIPCAHSVWLSRRGFEGQIMRPPSKIFPYGQVTYPLNPNDEEIKIPLLRRIGHLPFTMEELIPEPVFITTNPKQINPEAAKKSKEGAKEENQLLERYNRKHYEWNGKVKEKNEIGKALMQVIPIIESGCYKDEEQKQAILELLMKIAAKLMIDFHEMLFERYFTITDTYHEAKEDVEEVILRILGLDKAMEKSTIEPLRYALSKINPNEMDSENRVLFEQGIGKVEYAKLFEEMDKWHDEIDAILDEMETKLVEVIEDFWEKVRRANPEANGIEEVKCKIFIPEVMEGRLVRTYRASDAIKTAMGWNPNATPKPASHPG